MLWRPEGGGFIKRSRVGGDAGGGGGRGAKILRGQEVRAVGSWGGEGVESLGGRDDGD